MEEYQIILPNNKYCLVSKEDYNHLNKYKWYTINNGYIKSRINSKSYYIHRYIYKYILKEDITNYVIDHINGNPLDNRKCNLRIATKQQNMYNIKSHINSSSKYIGVSYRNDRKKWNSYITINGKKKSLGHFKDEIEAAKARDKAVIQFYGKYGRLNFSTDNEVQVYSYIQDENENE